MFTVAFTGHRPPKLGGYDRPDGSVPELRRRLRGLMQAALVETVAERGAVRVIVGGALGVDTDAARIAHFMGLPFTVAVPCLGQDSRWPEASRRVYRRMLDAAAEVVLVSDEPYSAAAMHRRNEWMVDRADALFAIYDGSRGGGTAACVAYATQKGCPLLRIWV